MEIHAITYQSMHQTTKRRTYNLMKPIKINVSGQFDMNEKKGFEKECDDAIIITSSVTGAVMDKTKNGDPTYTRQVDAWIGGFKTMPDMFTRLSEAVIQLITHGQPEHIAKHNLLSFIMFVVNNSMLKGSVKVSVNEDLLNGNTKEGNVTKKEV